MSYLQKVIEALESERDEIKERLSWVEGQIAEFRARAGGDSPAAGRGSANRAAPRPAATRRATTRRATVSRRNGNIKSDVVEFLKANPGSTAGDVAKGIDANRNTVATRLSQMTKDGQIKKAAKGYEAK